MKKPKVKTKVWPQTLSKKELLDELNDAESELDCLDNAVWELRKECERRKIKLD
jgi:hypothetical protein